MAIVVPVIAGLAVGIVLIVLFGVLTPSLDFNRNDEKPSEQMIKLNASKFSKIRDHPFLTDDVVTKSVQAASQYELTRAFLDKFGNSTRLEYSIAYLDSNQVNRTKYSSEGKQQEEFAFLRDLKPVIMLRLSVDRTPIEEHPVLLVYIDPETYTIYGAYKDSW